jgi:hypothetical protein
MHAFAEDSGAGKEFEEGPELARRITGFFQQFSARGRERGFPRLDASGDQFPESFARRVPELAHEEYPPIAPTGQHDDRTGVTNYLAIDDHSARFDHAINLEAHHFSLKYRPAAEDSDSGRHRVLLDVGRSMSEPARLSTKYRPGVQLFPPGV